MNERSLAARALMGYPEALDSACSSPPLTNWPHNYMSSLRLSDHSMRCAVLNAEDKTKISGLALC